MTPSKGAYEVNRHTVAEVVELIGTLKAKTAFAVPFVVAVITAIVNWSATGTFDATEIQLAAGGFIVGLLTAFGVYRAPAEAAVVKVPSDPVVASTQDASVTPDAPEA